MPRNAIYTASDKKYGDFLIDHWYRSLRDHTDLSDTEVRVLDYGLTTAQRYYLDHQGAAVVSCPRDGHPAVVRFRDMARDLERRPVDQVLSCDGGDILFQADLSPLFSLDPGTFRAVHEDLHSGFDAFLTEEFFTKADQRILQETLAGKPQINAGLVVGPADRFTDLCRTVHRMVLRRDKFGPDQLVVNAVLHSQGYRALDPGYNYVVATASRPFTLVGGTFLFADTLTPIPVVHNAGNWSVLRPIKDFGYGPGHNELKAEVLQTLRLVHHSTSFLLQTRDSWERLRRRAWDRALHGVRRFQKTGDRP